MTELLDYDPAIDLALFHPNQFVGVVTATLGLAEDGGTVAVGELRRAGENP